MDKRQLLHAVLQGEKIDRVLCGFWNHFTPEQFVGKAAVQAHIDYYNKIQPDMLKVMNEHFYNLDRSITKAADWAQVRPLPFEKTDYEDYIEEFKMIRRDLPKDLPLFATVHGVMISAYHGTEKPGGFDNPDNLISRHFREDPVSVAKALGTVAEVLSELCTRLIDAGADGIYYAALGGESFRFEQSLFEQYIKPYDAAVIDHIQDMGGLSILHICKAKTNVPMYAGINADIINWAVHENKHTLVEGREIFPGKTLLGGYDDRSGLMVDGSVEEIQARASEIVREVGRERLILGADCTLPGDVEFWRIRAVMDAAAKL